MRENCSECGLLGGRGEPGGDTRTRNTERGLLAGVCASETALRRKENMEGEGTGRKNCKSSSLHGKVRLHPSAVRRRAGPVRKHARPNAYTASARSRGNHASPILASERFVRAVIAAVARIVPSRSGKRCSQPCAERANQGVAEASLLRLGNGPLHFPQRHRHLQPNRQCECLSTRWMPASPPRRPASSSHSAETKKARWLSRRG